MPHYRSRSSLLSKVAFTRTQIHLGITPDDANRYKKAGLLSQGDPAFIVSARPTARLAYELLLELVTQHYRVSSVIPESGSRHFSTGKIDNLRSLGYLIEKIDSLDPDLKAIGNIVEEGTVKLPG